MKISHLLLIILGLTSCAGYQINPGSERIRVFEAEPKGCIYVGEISSIQDDIVEGKSAEPEMSLPTRVDLRNKAHALGGNILVFTKSKDKKAGAIVTSVPTPDPVKKGAAPAVAAAAEEEKTERKISTTFLATTFRCPASIVNQ